MIKSADRFRLAEVPEGIVGGSSQTEGRPQLSADEASFASGECASALMVGVHVAAAETDEEDLDIATLFVDREAFRSESTVRCPSGRPLSAKRQVFAK